MSFENAQKLVDKMKEDKIFRTQVLDCAKDGSLIQLLDDKELMVDLNELAQAMAACMDYQESCDTCS